MFVKFFFLEADLGKLILDATFASRKVPRHARARAALRAAVGQKSRAVYAFVRGNAPLPLMRLAINVPALGVLQHREK